MASSLHQNLTIPNVWQDRQIRFDLSPKLLELRKGEIIIDSINSVEDTKGNNGERGLLEMTNLRLIWASHKRTKTNLSIGYGCITALKIKTAHSKLRGTIQALFVMTKHDTSRFEFIFTSLVKASPRLFTTVQAVFRSYETTKLYRDLKLRGAILNQNELILLPQEQVYTKVNGVWNLSTDQGNLGTFFVTNIRVVWHANLAPNFNVSMPYMQIASLRCRGSKFGKALVIDTMPGAGGYVLGFTFESETKLKDVHREMISLHQVYSEHPVFGVEFEIEDQAITNETQMRQLRVQDNVEILEDDSPTADVFAAYYAAANKNKDREAVYSNSLGLAIESLPEEISLEQLWQI